MKVVGMVVNINFMIIGFELVGAAYEFGGTGNNTVDMPIKVEELANVRFDNGEISFEDGDPKSFICVDNFDIRGLRVLQQTEQGNIVEVPKRFVLEKQIIVDGVLGGYQCTLCNRTLRLTIDNIVNYAKVFSGDNFVVRYHDTNGKAFLAGKQGVHLDKLPKMIVGENKATTRQQTKAKAVTGSTAIRGTVATVNKKGMSILDLFNRVASIDKNAKIIDISGSDYRVSNTAYQKTSKDFIKFKNCGVGKPYINFSEKSLNVNNDFNYLGYVNLQLSSGMTSVYCYVNKEKHIFYNGQNYMSKFVIAVSTENSRQIAELRNEAVVIQTYTDQEIISNLRMFFGDTTGSIAFFEVDTSTLDIVNDSILRSSILTPDKMECLIKESLLYKSLNTFYNRVYNTVTKELEPYLEPVINPMYRGFSKNDLQIMADSGISLATGVYYKREEQEYAENDASEVMKAIQQGKDMPRSDAPKTKYEVEYTLSGMANSLSNKDIDKYRKDKVCNKTIFNRIPELASELDVAFMIVDGASDYLDLQEKVKAENSKIFIKRQEIKRKLWLHNMACFANGGYKVYNTNGTGGWEIESEVRDGYRYKNLTNPLLRMTVTGGLQAQ